MYIYSIKKEEKKIRKYIHDMLLLTGFQVCNIWFCFPIQELNILKKNTIYLCVDQLKTQCSLACPTSNLVLREASSNVSPDLPKKLQNAVKPKVKFGKNLNFKMVCNKQGRVCYQIVLIICPKLPSSLAKTGDGWTAYCQGRLCFGHFHFAASYLYLVDP